MPLGEQIAGAVNRSLDSVKHPSKPKTPDVITLRLPVVQKTRSQIRAEAEQGNPAKPAAASLELAGARPDIPTDEAPRDQNTEAVQPAATEDSPENVRLALRAQWERNYDGMKKEDQLPEMQSVLIELKLALAKSIAHAATLRDQKVTDTLAIDAECDEIEKMINELEAQMEAGAEALKRSA